MVSGRNHGAEVGQPRFTNRLLGAYVGHTPNDGATHEASRTFPSNCRDSASSSDKGIAMN